jgi:hypothetical protein
MLSLACPRCGETEELRGQSVASQIEITCLSCGSRFPREAPTCRSCGRPEPVHGSQRMTRYARGLLVAVVGMRNVLLCRVCDDEVASAVAQRSELVPEGYVSRFLFGEVPTLPPPEPRRTSASAQEPRISPRAPDDPPRATPPRAAPIQRDVVQDPTVRQAIEVFLAHSTGPQDSLCLVLLGAELGPSTRVSRLGAEHRDALPGWVASKFGEAETPRRHVAVSTIIDLVDHWRDQGWTTHDIAASLR